MKKSITLFIIISIFAVFHGFGQPNLYGLAQFGGNNGNGGGTILRVKPESSSLSAFPLNTPDGESPDNLILASNGKFYGTTSTGGSITDQFTYFGNGNLFSYDPLSGAYQILHNFGTAPDDGMSPGGRLLEASNGLLYGMTDLGGTSGLGTIFSYNISNSTYTVLYSFAGGTGDGAIANGGLTQALNGLLYGMTEDGGTNGTGIIFSFNPKTSAYAILHNFGGVNDGAFPFSDLTLAINGNLYGMTNAGGSFGNGTIFSFSPLTSSYSVAYNFGTATSDGSFPYGDLTQATDGKLYGMTDDGGTDGMGIIFSFNLFTSAYEILHNFSGTPGDGAFPFGSLTETAGLKFFGMTGGGGTDQDGTIFSFSPLNSGYSVLHNFSGSPTDGNETLGNFTPYFNGRLYGITGTGGIANEGIIFSFSTNSDNLVIVHNFGPNVSGSSPQGGLLKANGQLYGTTNSGGTYNQGVIFSYNPNGSRYAELYDFGTTPNDGVQPTGLVQGNDGKFYGMTDFGGANGVGTIFSFSPGHSTYTVLHNFGSSSTDGGDPSGILIKASNGKLYGLTEFGGANGDGTIFSFDPASSSYTILYNLGSNASDGFIPVGNLVQASDKKLYGMTFLNGTNGDGTIFSFDPKTLVFSTVYTFGTATNDGNTPQGGLIQANNGKLYGTTDGGGANGEGVLFSFAPAVSAYNILYNFGATLTDGQFPAGGLVQASDGRLYGLTEAGGTNGIGTVFAYSIATASYVVVQNLDLYQSGYYPWAGSFLVEFDAQNPEASDALTTVDGETTQDANGTVLNAVVYPSPSTSSFNLTITGNRPEISEIRVFDVTGKTLDHMTAKSGETIRFGSSYTSGTYIVEVLQGPEHKVLKAIKQ